MQQESAHKGPIKRWELITSVIVLLASGSVGVGTLHTPMKINLESHTRMLENHTVRLNAIEEARAREYPTREQIRVIGQKVEANARHLENMTETVTMNTRQLEKVMVKIENIEREIRNNENSPR